MELTPKISIIIPVYNVEKYIRKCLDSVIVQSLEDIEIICIDDGSKDNSLSILGEYAENDSRIVVISQDNQGASEARNRALDVAKGDCIMFVDGDDWVSEDVCEKLYEVMIEESADVVMCAFAKEYKTKSVPVKVYQQKSLFKEQEVKNKLYRRMVGIVDEELRCPEQMDALCTIWAKLYRRSAIYDKGTRFYDIKKIGTYEDGLFNLSVFENVKKVCYIPEILYNYRKDNMSSLTTAYNKRLVEQHEKIHKYLRDYIESKRLNDIFKDALNNRIALELVGYGLNILRAKETIFKKIKRIELIISNAPYKEAYKSLSLKYFPIHWKIFYGCAKCNFATGVYVLLCCIRKIIGREE